MKTFLRFPLFVSLASLVVPVFAFAQTITITNTQGAHNEICNVFNWMFWILMAVSVIMVMWAAYMYVTAAGDEEQVSNARNAIFYAAIGILAALTARGFPLLVASVFSSAQGINGC